MSGGFRPEVDIEAVAKKKKKETENLVESLILKTGKKMRIRSVNRLHRIVRKH